MGEKRGYNEIRLRREGSARYELSLRRFVQRGGSWEPEGAVLRWEIAGGGAGG